MTSWSPLQLSIFPQSMLWCQSFRLLLEPATSAQVLGGKVTIHPHGTDACWIWGGHFAAKPLPNALGTSLLFCFSLFDVPAACCVLYPSSRDSIACCEMVGVVRYRRKVCACVCVWMGEDGQSLAHQLVNRVLQEPLYIPRVLARSPNSSRKPSSRLDLHHTHAG